MNDDESAPIPENTARAADAALSPCLHTEESAPPPSAAPPLRRVLNLGCGASAKHRLPPLFHAAHWREVRIDLDPAVRPDLLASVATLAYLTDACADAIWSSHSLEHLEFYQVPQALAEMYRVLKPGGFALITLPDLQAVARLILEGKLTATIYHSPLGPIRALDMLFGHSASVAAGRRYMAHRCGFDDETLGRALLEAGFREVRIRKGTCYDLWAYARR